MFEIEFEEGADLIVARLHGFWTEKMVEPYRHELMRVIALSDRPFDMMIDLRDFPNQEPAVVARFVDLIAECDGMGRRRTALLADSSLERIQRGRIASEDHVYFETEANARCWLTQRAASAPIRPRKHLAY